MYIRTSAACALACINISWTVHIWNVLLNVALLVAGFLEAHSAALVQLMFHTLPFYHDLDSQRAVTATVKQAVVNGTFLKTLAGALVKLDVAAMSRQVSSCACCL